MRAADDRLHPAQTRITGRADLGRIVLLRRQLLVAVGALVQQQFPITISRPNQFALPGNVHKIIIDRRRPLPEFRITRAFHANARQQSHSGIHIAAKLGHAGSLNRFEMINQLWDNVVRELAGQLRLPFRQDALGIQR